MNTVIKKMFAIAKKARQNAHVPYSKFKVGAAVLTSNGKIYAGCNVENATYTLTTHAEMNVIDSAVAAGYQMIKKILIVVDAPEPAFPCALCRQKIIEFSDDTEIIATNLDGKYLVSRIGDLYPKAFTMKNLKK